MGYRPGAWERLSPAEIWKLWDAWKWRHSRRIEVAAISTLWTMSVWGKIDQKKTLHSYPGYEPDSED